MEINDNMITPDVYFWQEFVLQLEVVVLCFDKISITTFEIEKAYINATYE